MNDSSTTQVLPPVWLQAAVLGSLWAASEIILGSFFHSLKLPLRSLILAAIGIVLMVAIGRRWKIKGLFWRAGLICAIMKSISPGGLILSPMVAIAAQGLLMELCTRVGGKNLFGFLIGGMLAITWNLFQFIAYHILIYGFDILSIYQKIYKIATEIFPLPAGDFWLPVYVSLSMHLLFGAAAAIAGYLLSGADPKHMLSEGSLKTRDVKYFQRSLQKKRAWSTVFLYVNLFLFLGYFVPASLLKFPWDVLPALPILTFWLVKYRGNLRILKKPVFWIVFIVITLLSSLAIGQAQQGFQGFSINGLWIGVSMNVRAFTLVIGFAVIGYELSNPTIRQRIKNPGARRLFLAMEAASKALPVIIAHLPGPALFFTRPRAVFVYLIYKTTSWLQELQVSIIPHSQLILITGAIHAGKTSLLRDVLPLLHKEGIQTAGFICNAIFEKGKRQGYDILDTYAGRCVALGRTSVKSEIQIGSYYISPEGLQYGYSLLQNEMIEGKDIIIIDEIGPWELTGHGWARELPRLLQHSKLPMIWVVRKPIVDDVVEQWNLQSPLLIEADSMNAEEAAKLINQRIAEIKTNQPKDES